MAHQDVFELFKLHKVRSLGAFKILRPQFLHKQIPFFVAWFLIDVQEMLLKVLLANLKVHFTIVATWRCANRLPTAKLGTLRIFNQLWATLCQFNLATTHQILPKIKRFPWVYLMAYALCPILKRYLAILVLVKHPENILHLRVIQLETPVVQVKF